MSKNNKESKPWSFGLFGGKGGKASVIVFFVIVCFSVVIHICGAVMTELQDRRLRPALALKSVLRDVRQFVKNEKAMPRSFREIENKLWNKAAPELSSRLIADDIMVKDNYEYFYRAGMVQNNYLVNVWAIPLGKYRDQYETVLVVITTEGEDFWRGPALNEVQRQFVYDRGFNPTFVKMSELNMRRDSVIKPKEKKGMFF